MIEILSKDCECWRQTVSLNFVDRSFPKEALRHIYCPRCSRGIQKNEGCMVEEKGWVIEYDPNLLRPASANVCLIKHMGKIDSFSIYVDKRRKIGST